jgi:hypothetical protein
MQQHIEVEHLEFLNPHVANFIGVKGNLRSQSICVLKTTRFTNLPINVKM